MDDSKGKAQFDKDRRKADGRACNNGADCETQSGAEACFHQFFEGHDAIMLLIDVDTGAIMAANSASSRFYGFTVEQLTKMNINDIDQTPPRQAQAEREQARREGRSYWVRTHRLANGETRTMETHASIIELQDHQYWFAIIHDISERVRADEELKGYHEHLKELVRERTEELEAKNMILGITMEQARLAHWVFDLDTGMFTFDDNFYELYGTTTEREGGPLMSAETYTRRFIHPDDAWMVSETMQKALATTDLQNTAQVEHRIIRADGEERFIVVRARNIRDESGRPIGAYGANQDVTEIKAKERDLIRLNRTLQAMNNSSQAMMLAGCESEYLNRICRIIVDDCGHAMVWVGLAEEDERKTVRPVASAGSEEGYLERAGVSWADIDRGQGPAGTAIRTGKPTLCRNILTDPYFKPWRDEAARRGHRSVIGLPLVFDGRVFGAITIYSTEIDSFSEHEVSLLTKLADDTAFGVISIRMREEHGRSREALQESEERFRKVFEKAPLCIAMVGADYRFIRTNAAFRSMLGYTEEELTSLTFRDVTHPDYLEEDLRRVSELADGKAAVYQTEKRYVRKDRTLVWGSLLVTVIRDKNDRFLYFLAMVEDITERKNAEIERKRLESELLQAQKMEAIGTLAGGVAHDFNNILTVLIGFSSLLQTKMEPDDPKQGYVSQILASSERAAQLTKSLLAFSRKQKVDLRPRNLNHIVQSVMKLLERLLSEEIVLKVSLTSDDPSVLADVTQVEQILINLAANARDAMPRGGELIIETTVRTIGDEFFRDRGYGKPGEYAVIAVSDTGTGMDEKTIEHIFEPFFTTKGVGKGTGLGLSTVYGIVKQHDGYITVDSKPAMGSTFRVLLPLAGRDEEEMTRQIRTAGGGQETILIAEDDAGVRGLTAEVLRSHGYRTIEACDGEEAVRVFMENKDSVDLIIIDVIMPKKNGREAYEEIRRAVPHIKALFTSGYTDDLILERGIHDGVYNFAAKPLAPEDLLLKVREVLDE